MALYALDEDSNLVFALKAQSGRRYRCLECRSPVQKRLGRHRRPHFCHLRSAPQCRLHSKSIDHLIIQAYLQEHIPALQSEKPFPSILRIADLCWEEKQLVFEIQCSPITLNEAMQRRIDYAREGYHLVWLLDDRLFNKKTLRIAELFLRMEAGYFFSLKKSLVYDQFELFNKEMRVFKGPPLPVYLSYPLPMPKSSPLKQLKKRTSCFVGDLLDRSLKNSAYLSRLAEQEAALLRQKRPNPLGWLKRQLLMGLSYLVRKSIEADRF